jgi:hypothetical protein
MWSMTGSRHAQHIPDERLHLLNERSIGNITAFGCTVVSITTQPDGFIASVRVGTASSPQQRRKLLLSHPETPIAQGQARRGISSVLLGNFRGEQFFHHMLVLTQPTSRKSRHETIRPERRPPIKFKTIGAMR